MVRITAIIYYIYIGVTCMVYLLKELVIIKIKICTIIVAF